MKSYKLILLAVVGACTFSACSGDHAANGGSDSTTTSSNFDTHANLDTFKVTNQMGEATQVENAGNGGTTIVKDTTHMKVRSVPVPVAAPAAAPAAAAAPKDSTAATAAKK